MNYINLTLSIHQQTPKSTIKSSWSHEPWWITWVWVFIQMTYIDQAFSSAPNWFFIPWTCKTIVRENYFWQWIGQSKGLRSDMPAESRWKNMIKLNPGTLMCWLLFVPFKHWALNVDPALHVWSPWPDELRFQLFKALVVPWRFFTGGRCWNTKRQNNSDFTGQTALFRNILVTLAMPLARQKPAFCCSKAGEALSWNAIPSLNV